MPNISARGGRRRRTISEINMVPFIDVMLVLLIIFMVSAPLITTGVVDLPSMGASSRTEAVVIEVIVGADGQLRIKRAGQNEVRVGSAQLGARVREAQAGAQQAPVVISAERGVRYEAVVEAMDALREAGVARVGLLVKQRVQ